MKRCLACWILALSLAPSLWAQAPALTFEHVTAEDGLSNNWIWAVRQDRQGFLWIGTLDGLDRYDGYAYLAHQHQPNDTTSLAQNEVRDLVEDANGDLWVAAGGLHRLDRATGRFIRYEVGRESPLSIHALAVDGKDDLWLYTDEGGLFRYNAGRDTLVTYASKWFGASGASEEAGSDFRFSDHPLTIDGEGTLWVSTYFGKTARLHRYQAGADHFEDVSLPEAMGVVRVLHAGRSGTFWIGGEQV